MIISSKNIHWELCDCSLKMTTNYPEMTCRLADLTDHQDLIFPDFLCNINQSHHYLSALIVLNQVLINERKHNLRKDVIA